MPFAIPCNLSSLISYIHSSFFWTGGVPFHLNYLTHRSLRCPLRNFSPSSYSLFLSRLRYNGHSLLAKTYFDRIGRQESFMQRLQISDLKHFSSHFALSSYGLFAPFALWQFFVSLRLLVQTLRSCPVSGVPWSSTMLPSLGRDRKEGREDQMR